MAKQIYIQKLYNNFIHVTNVIYFYKEIEENLLQNTLQINFKEYCVFTSNELSNVFYEFLFN